MIQAKTAKTNGFELSDKSQTVLLDREQIKLGAESIKETGEFEISGVEVIYGKSAALIIWEQMQIVYVFGLEAPTAFEKEQFSSGDIVIFADTIAELNKVAFGDIMSSYDPTLVIFHKDTPIEKTFKDSLKISETNLAKIAEQSLPAEGRELVVVG